MAARFSGVANTKPLASSTSDGPVSAARSIDDPCLRLAARPPCRGLRHLQRAAGHGVIHDQKGLHAPMVPASKRPIP
jgi:hypothetical protein